MSMARFHRDCVRRVCWSLVLGCWATSAVAATAADRLQPRRDLVQAQVERFRRLRAERLQALPPFVREAHAPRRQGLHRPGPTTAATGAPAALAAGLPDTVHILMARIGFDTNRAPNLTSMSGPEADGFFQSAPDPAAIIDPPPHDAAYFDAHLLALRRYYEVMSRGQLVVKGTVFPPVDEPALTMSDIADYGPGAGGIWSLVQFEKYFGDAIRLLDAAAAGRIDLLPYTYDASGQRLGSIVLVHPGSDFQNDINQDSPNDLPTFFITLADSIPVQGNLEVRHGLVLPETTIQDGLLGSIQAPLCHEVGHLLGLPDWYDTRFGLPTIGEWSLMDSGSAALFAFVVEGNEDEPIFALGLLPTGLSAMDRVLLGWEEPTLMRAPADSVSLRPANADARFGDFPTCAKLEVSPEEYFLVENRRDLLARRFPEDRDFCPYLNRDAQTGVVLWMSKDDPNTPSRDRHNTGEYDFWISAPTAPDTSGGACGEFGFGLLVWHVDERPMAEGFASNSVNNDERYRALRVVEASGDYEIGDWRLPTVSFLGDGWNDPFRQGFWTRLGSQTVPNNWNSDWALTGWEITDVRTVLPEAHQLYARVQDGVTGWPKTFWITPDSLLQVDPPGALVSEVSGLGRTLVVADSAAVHLWTGDRRLDVFEAGLQPGSLAGASATFASDAFETLAVLDGDSLRLWQANWDGTTLPLRSGFPLAVPGGGGTRIVLAAEARMGLAETKAGAWMPFDATGWSGASFDLDPDTAEAGIVVGDLRRGDADSLEVVLVGPSAVEIRRLIDSELLRRVALDLPATGKLFVAGGRMSPVSEHAQVVILHEQGRLRVIDGDGTVRLDYPDLPADHYLGIALGDLDADGFLDLIATSAQRLVGLNSRGARLFGTPRLVQEMFALRSAQNTVTPPIVADVTGDALPEILWATDLGLLYALDASGTLVPGYPRKVLPDFFPAALLADDLDAVDATREVIAVSSASASVFALPGGSSGSAWSAQGGGAARTHFAADPSVVVPGNRLLAVERPILAYPNPSRGDLVQLRIASAAAGPYEIRIYNLEGELVFENRGMVSAGAAQEIPWSVSNLASGIYLCRFVSPAAGVVSPLVERISVLR